jgi:aspartate aminotransferase
MVISRTQTSGLHSSPAAAFRRKVNDLRSEGRTVIDLTAGDLDFPSPPHAVEAAVRAARAGETRYTNVDGTPELKDAVREHFRRQNGLSFDRSEIIVSTGSSQAIANAFAVTLQPGDEVIIPTPSWATYAGQAALAGGSPVFVSCAQNNGFKLRAADLAGAITERTRWIVINNPVNPTGALYTGAELAELCTVLRQHPHVRVLADNLYEHLVFDGRKAVTPLEVAPDLRDRTVTISGVAKSYSMMGWRIGYAAGPPALIADMTRVQYLTTSCPSSISQAAAAAALLGPQDLLAERADILRAKRDLLVDLLNGDAGLACVPPEATFYLCVSCAGVIGRRKADGGVIATGADVSDHLLGAAGIAVLPGEAYGMPGYVRASFAVPTEDIHQAGRLIAEACRALA